MYVNELNPNYIMLSIRMDLNTMLFLDMIFKQHIFVSKKITLQYYSINEENCCLFMHQFYTFGLLLNYLLYLE